MTNQDYLKEFARFLKENNALGKYRRAFLKRTNYKKIPCDLLKFLELKGFDMNNPKDLALCFLSSAFIWCDTREGNKYWHTMNQIWKKKVYETIDQRRI